MPNANQLRLQLSTLVGAVLGCACLVSCAAPPVPPVTTVLMDPPPGTPGVDPLSPEERLLALLTADNPRIEQVAQSLAHLGDARLRHEAGRRLVALAQRTVASPPPRGPDDPAPDRRWLVESSTDVVAPILVAMSYVGGPEVIAYCFALAENEAAPWDRRRLAVRVLHLVVPDEDGPTQERRRRLALIRPGPPSARPYDAARALLPAGRACMRRLQGPVPTCNVILTVHVDASGHTTATGKGTAPPELRECLVDAANHLQMPPPLEGAGELVVPFSFISQ